MKSKEIAKTLQDIFPTLADDNQRVALAYKFARTIKARSPAFRDDLFMRACGLNFTDLKSPLLVSNAEEASSTTPPPATTTA